MEKEYILLLLKDFFIYWRERESTWAASGGGVDREGEKQTPTDCRALLGALSHDLEIMA